MQNSEFAVGQHQEGNKKVRSSSSAAAEGPSTNTKSKKCCRCCPVNQGPLKYNPCSCLHKNPPQAARLASIFTIILNLVPIMYKITTFSYERIKTDEIIGFAVFLCFCVFLIILSILLIYGVQIKSVRFSFAWIIFQFLIIMLTLTLIITNGINLSVRLRQLQDISTNETETDTETETEGNSTTTTTLEPDKEPLNLDFNTSLYIIVLSYFLCHFLISIYLEIIVVKYASSAVKVEPIGIEPESGASSSARFSSYSSSNSVTPSTSRRSEPSTATAPTKDKVDPDFIAAHRLELEDKMFGR